MLACVLWIGALHPANCRTGKAGGGEGEAGRKSRQKQGTTDWKEQSCALPYSRESFWGWELLHITLCVCEEVREVASPEKKLADPSLQNLTFVGCCRKVNLFIPDHCFLLNCPQSHSCFHSETPSQVGYVLFESGLCSHKSSALDARIQKSLGCFQTGLIVLWCARWPPQKKPTKTQKPLQPNPQKNKPENPQPNAKPNQRSKQKERKLYSIHSHFNSFNILWNNVTCSMWIKSQLWSFTQSGESLSRKFR